MQGLWLLLLVAIATCQDITNINTDQELQSSVLPCSTKYFKWKVTPRSTAYYLEVNVTTVSAQQFVVVLSPQVPSPQLSGGIPLSQPKTDYCVAARGTTSAVAGFLLVLDEYCAVTDGDWYISVETASTTDESFFRVLPSVKAIPNPTELLISANSGVPGTQIVVRAPSGTPYDDKDVYFFDLSKNPQTTPGTRVRIEIIPDNAPNTSISTFLNLNRTALPNTECGVLLNGGPAITLDACTYKQGGKWFLTVVRDPLVVRSYTAKVYLETPLIVDFDASGSMFSQLSKADDVIYFRYTNLASKVVNSTFVVVADNVENGAVTLGLLQNTLPFQECVQNEIQCFSDVSCFVTVPPCSQTTGPWFFGVRAEWIDIPNELLTFTVSVVITPVASVTIPVNVSTPGTVQRGQYQQYNIVKPVGDGDWLKVHIYVDYTQVAIPSDVALYVGTQPLTGHPNDGSCFLYKFICTATHTSKDVGSCSIQLDPCQLADFGSTLYMSVRAVLPPRFTYFFSQNFVAFTLTPEVTNPSRAPYTISQDRLVVTSGVPESQYEIYSVSPFVGLFQIYAAVTDDKSTAGIEVAILSGSKVQGPTCKCWAPLSKTVVTLASGSTRVFQSDVCQNFASAGLFVAVRALPTASPSFTFIDRQFSLLIVKNSSANSTDIVPTTLLPGVETVFYAGQQWFSLSFPRTSLTSKSLVITTKASTINSTLTANLYRFPSSPKITCDISASVRATAISWTLDTNNIYTLAQDCIFSNDTDATTFLVSTDSTSSQFAAFSIVFELVDIVPTALTTGVKLSGKLRQNVYKHFYLDVLAADAGKKNLLIEVYFDAGVQEGTNNQVSLFVNTPIIGDYAGDTIGIAGTNSCFCNQYSFSDKRKVVFAMNACQLRAGRYYFSILTRQAVYDNYPALFTISPTLNSALVGPARLDFPFDFSSYIGQPYTFQLNIPATMLTGITNTSRVLKINIETTKPSDQVAAYLSRNSPSDAGLTGNTSLCSCFSVASGFSCTTDLTTTCRIQQEYCKIADAGGAGVWYLTTYAKATLEPQNPVAFSVFVTMKNDYDQIIALPATLGCGGSGKTVQVNNKQYQYFSINTQGLTLTGQEKFELRVRNVGGGAVSFASATNNLPTLQCATSVQTCASTDCDLSLQCGSNASLLSAYAISSFADPVQFDVTVCYSAVAPYTLNTGPLSFQKLAMNASKTYKIDRSAIAALNVSRAPIIVATLSAYSVNPQTATHDFALNNGQCSTCATPSFQAIPGVTRRTCGSSDTDACNVYLYGCNFPSDYGTTDWYVEIANGASGLAEIQYNFEVTSLNIGDNVINVTTGTNASFTIQARGWLVLSWTISAAEIAASDSNLLRAQILVTGAAPSVPAVQTFLGIGTIAFPTCATMSNLASFVVQPCCTQPQRYFLTVQNTGSTAALVNVAPQLISSVTIVRNQWNSATASFNATEVLVRQVDDNVALVNVVAPFPGIGSGAHLFIYVTNSDIGATSFDKLYIATNGVAGSTSSSCFTADFLTETVVTSDSPFGGNYYPCDPTNILPASNYWFGLARSSVGVASPQITSWNVFMYILPEIQIPFNQTFVAPPHLHTSQHRQFYVIMPNNFRWDKRLIRFTVVVTSASGSLVYSVNPGTPAGTGFCRGALITSNSASQGNPQSVNLPSCMVTPGGRYYIGVEPASAGDQLTYTILVTTVEPTTPLTQVTLDVPLNVNVPLGSSSTFQLTNTGPWPTRSYLKAWISNRSGALPATTWQVDGDCAEYDTSASDLTRQTPIVTTIIFPCQLQNTGQYHFTLSANAASVDGQLTISSASAAPYFLTVNQAFSATMSELELAYFNLSVSPNDILPGQKLIVTLSDVSCGSVAAWINRGAPGGPLCNYNKNITGCTTPGCQLLSLDGCDMDDWTDQWWITVRSLHQNLAQTPIKFTIIAAVTGAATFRPIHTNEKQVIYGYQAVQPPTVQQQCAAQALAPLVTCCSVAPSTPTNVTLEVEPVQFVYPTEGAYMLDNSHTITLSLSEFVASAIMFLSPHVPSFCRVGSLPLPNPLYCTATYGSPCNITLSPRSFGATGCEWVDKVRQMYISVDPRTVTWRQGVTNIAQYPQGRVPLMTVTSSVDAYSITAITYDPAVKFLQFDLEPNEIQYILYSHPTADVLATIKNYNFDAAVTHATGPIRLLVGWNTCGSQYCTNPTCTTYPYAGVAVPDRCTPNTRCTCSAVSYRCTLVPGDSRRLAIYNPGTSLLSGSLKIQFTQPEEPITQSCEVVTGGTNRWYLPALGQIGARQLYKFDIQYFQDFDAQVNTSVGSTGSVDLAVADGYVAFRNACVSALAVTSSTGVQSSILWRRSSEPHLAVYGQVGVARNNYRLAASLYTVTVVTLENGKAVTSPSIGKDASQCTTQVTSQWFVFPSALAKANGFLLVQLWGAGASVFMNLDYVTYQWTPLAGHSCTTGATGYCIFIVSCAYQSAHDYFFHVPSNAFSLMVTWMPTPTATQVLVGDSVIADLVPGQMLTYSLAVNGNSDGSWRDLVVSTSTTISSNVHSWISSGAFTGFDCALDHDVGIQQNFIISPCNLGRNTSKIFVSFFLPRPAPPPVVFADSCKNYTVTLTSYYKPDTTPAIAASVPGPTPVVGKSSQQNRVRFTPGTITVNDVVYVRVSDITNGDATLTRVSKGNFITAVKLPAIGASQYPCPTCSAIPQFPHVAWFDECFFCPSVFDTVFVDTQVQSAAPTGNDVNFNVDVKKVAWTQLSSSWVSGTLSDNKGTTENAADLAFYRSTLTITQGQSLDLQVTAGAAVYVQIYGECNSYAAPIQYWCYQGAMCQLPFPTASNFAASGSTLAGSRLRVVVSGKRAQFRIRHLTPSSGLPMCAAPTTTSTFKPFCNIPSVRPDGLVWSSDINSTLQMKDAWASDRYDALLSAFSCPVSDSCNCVALSDACKLNLKTYACMETLHSCTDQGFALAIPASLCTAVESTCLKSFKDAGFPELTCLHSFYGNNPAKWVNANGGTVPVPPPGPDTSGTVTGSATSTVTTSGALTTAGTTSAATTSGGSTSSGAMTTGTDQNFTTSGDFNTTGSDGLAAEEGLSGGAIAGIVIGVLLVVAAIGAAVFVFLVKKGRGGLNVDSTAYESILNQELRQGGSYEEQL